ncbi:sugar ABC transporter substrate-binding protein [Pseudolysinimonas sp.]
MTVVRGRRSWPALVVALLATLIAATGCAAPAPTGDGVVALLLPESGTARYERLDRPLFEEQLAEAGDYRVISANAGGSASRQLEQAESALAAGADVLVVNPVDQVAARSIVDAATALGVPVVSYDRLIDGGGAAFYVSFDNERVGMLQAEALVAGMRARGTPRGDVLVLAGDPNDANTTQLSAGFERVLRDADIPVLARYDVPGWSAAKAQEWMATQVAQFGDRIQGVYAGNDGLAGAAIAAFRTGGLGTAPIVTGQDADLAAVRRILAGTQYATVFKNIATQARVAADAATALAEGRVPEASSTVDGVPSVVLEPVLVTVDDIAATIVANDLYPIADICAPDLLAECAAAGVPVARRSPRLGG